MPTSVRSHIHDLASSVAFAVADALLRGISARELVEILHRRPPVAEDSARRRRSRSAVGR
jgi:hypothetical protein